MKSTTLSAEHYAAGWPVERTRTLAEMNELGCRYAATRNPNLLLEICQAFHAYLMKYLVMICRGHTPIVGSGKNPNGVNNDSKQFIRYFYAEGRAVHPYHHRDGGSNLPPGNSRECRRRKSTTSSWNS